MSENELCRFSIISFRKNTEGAGTDSGTSEWSLFVPVKKNAAFVESPSCFLGKPGVGYLHFLPGGSTTAVVRGMESPAEARLLDDDSTPPVEWRDDALRVGPVVCSRSSLPRAARLEFR